MIHAYQEIYLRHAQAALGDAFDYAVNTCGISGTDFSILFVGSTISRRMENGEPKYLSGKSGIEIVYDVVWETMGKELTAPPKESMWRSCEYWIGWAVAYYQWYSARKYSDIFKALPFDELQRMYPTLHEADITKFVDAADKRIRDCFPETSLKRIRSAYGCSQSELAQLSGVSLRSIQMYEQRNKDINKAKRRNRFPSCKSIRLPDRRFDGVFCKRRIKVLSLITAPQNLTHDQHKTNPLSECCRYSC